MTDSIYDAALRDLDKAQAKVTDLSLEIARHKLMWEDRMQYLYEELPFSIRMRWGGDWREFVQGLDYGRKKKKTEAVRR